MVKNSWYWLLFGSYLGSSLSPSALAQEVAPVTPTLRSKVVTQMKSQKAQSSQINFDLRYEHVAYPVKLDESSQIQSSNNTSSQADLTFSSENFKNRFFFYGNRDWVTESAQFGLHELSSSFQTHSFQVTVGRSIRSWSELDQEWSLGLWQPIFAVDSLRPQTQGLTGLFVDLGNNSSRIKSTFFATPLFIPTMAPEIREDRGSLAADSRWFKSPSTTSPVFNQETEVRYSLSVPEIEKLVANPSYGLKFEIPVGSQVLTRFAGSSKPVNRLALKYQRLLVLTEGEQQASATVSPVMTYETLFSGDLVWRNSQRSVAFSALSSRPQEPKLEAGWIVQKIPASQIYGVTYVEQSLNLLGFTPQFLMSYLQINTENVVDLDESGKVVGSIFKERDLYTRALKAEVTLNHGFLGKDMKQKLKVLREFDQVGSLVMYEARLRPVKNFEVFGGFDILGVDNPEAPVSQTSFLNQFRSNDRIFGGVAYVF